MASLEGVKDMVKINPAVLLYFKNDECAPCLVLRPKVNELIESSFPKMELIIIDTVRQPEFAGEFQVYANPTLLVFFDGKEYIRRSRFVGIPALKSEISRLYKMIFI